MTHSIRSSTWVWNPLEQSHSKISKFLGCNNFLQKWIQAHRGYVTSEGGVHWWGEKRIKTWTQSNNHSMLTWHLISHREKTLNAFIILQCMWLTALNISVLLYQVKQFKSRVISEDLSGKLWQSPKSALYHNAWQKTSEKNLIFSRLELKNFNV